MHPTNKIKGLFSARIFLFSFAAILSVAVGRQVPKIAIVGAGIGGTSCAYFLNNLFDGDVAIDLYEAGNVGGRLLQTQEENSFFEVGGAIIHPRNAYMKNFVHEFGLNRKESSAEVIGLYDGKEFVFLESESEYITVLKMLWRYGLDIFKMRNYVSSMLDNFSKIYDHQEKGQCYETVHDLLNSMDSEFPMYLEKSIKNSLVDYFHERLIDELVYATIRVNYGQNNNVHQFVGSVSIAGAMDGLWSVKGGNYQVAEKLLEKSNAKLLKEAVNTITLINNKSELKVKASNHSDVYDAIIIAAPLTNDAHYPIDFLDFPVNISIPGSYHRTVCTLITGFINKTYFGYSDTDRIPDGIFTIKEDTFYNSISLLKANGENSVYKVFSKTILNNEQLNLLFKVLSNIKIIDWLAYPEYSTLHRNDTFILHERLYHVNAIEWAASAMEMSVIGARNVALLVYRDLTKHDPKRNLKEDMLHKEEL